ncbi:transposase [Endomicrobium proavitum]|uniref:Transposase n=1 Tax=Endomicrobium proavitum TaxID=1408281 RepID=A0A0G3WLM6_9BACT|nr:transposase [Endomicrobium proavitum]AKL98404.1 transposase [Endomicrobium proavitum]
MWITQGYTVKQLSKLSEHSQSTIRRTLKYWLSKEPNLCDEKELSKITHVLYDATYFHRGNCFLVLADNKTKKIFFCEFVRSENYQQARNYFDRLKAFGLRPKVLISDANQTILKVFQDVWANAIMQRCLIHASFQTIRFLHKNSKTKAAQDLKSIAIACSRIKSQKNKEEFENAYTSWRLKYEPFIKSLPNESYEYKEINKANTFLKDSLKDIFYFLKDRQIASNTNYLENLFKTLKENIRRHNGLTKKHKIAFVKWFFFFKNPKKTTLFEH